MDEDPLEADLGPADGRLPDMARLELRRRATERLDVGAVQQDEVLEAGRVRALLGPRELDEDVVDESGVRVGRRRARRDTPGPLAVAIVTAGQGDRGRAERERRTTRDKRGTDGHAPTLSRCPPAAIVVDQQQHKEVAHP
jgi:hypothetical protein